MPKKRLLDDNAYTYSTGDDTPWRDTLKRGNRRNDQVCALSGEEKVRKSGFKKTEKYALKSIQIIFVFIFCINITNISSIICTKAIHSFHHRDSEKICQPYRTGR